MRATRKKFAGMVARGPTFADEGTPTGSAGPQRADGVVDGAVGLRTSEPRQSNDEDLDLGNDACFREHLSRRRGGGVRRATPQMVRNTSRVEPTGATSIVGPQCRLKAISTTHPQAWLSGGSDVRDDDVQSHRSRPAQRFPWSTPTQVEAVSSACFSAAIMEAARAASRSCSARW